MIDEGAKRARPDILAADQPQPIEPLVVAQTNVCIRQCSGPRPRIAGSMTVRRARGYGGEGVTPNYAPAPIFGSVPAISRAMFARWVIHTATAKTANSTAGSP
jgi:hypothetical protein